jgi:hypothetical protein
MFRNIIKVLKTKFMFKANMISLYIYVQCVHKRMAQFQKLTRNLFLNLHGQNIHRQHRLLSKFLIRYQQFASHAYYGTAGLVSTMASQQEKAFCDAILETDPAAPK